MWMDTNDARELIESAVRQHMDAPSVQNAVATIHSVVSASSPIEMQALVTTQAFLASEWVIQLLWDIRSELREDGSRALVHNLSMTILALSFFYERRLRDAIVVPRALAADYKRWSDLAERQPLAMADAIQLLDLARQMIASDTFDELDRIGRRDIYRVTAEQLLANYNDKPQAVPLDTIAHYLSEAASLCPDYSMDFVRCVQYGGLSMLIRAQTTNSTQDLDTAILLLRHAVAAADDNYLENFVGPSSHALARAYLLRFERAHDLSDLHAAHEIFVYSISNVRARGEDLEPDTPAIAAMLSDALRQQGDRKQLAELTSVLAGTE